MKQMKCRLFMGAMCEQIVYNTPDGVRNIELYDPEKKRKERFESEEMYLKFKKEISRRNHLRLFHANFSPSSIYCTLTFDNEWEVHTFEEAKIVRKRFVQALRRAYPDVVIFLYMGRGKSTNRIHFHMVSEGVPEEFIVKKWKYGTVRHIEHLREHNWYEGKDHGRDYTGLANYLFNHWTEEVGGHRFFHTKNARKPDKEPAKEVRIRGGYTAKRPPDAPKGYMLVDVKATTYGCCRFIYVVIPPKAPRRSNSKNCDNQLG